MEYVASSATALLVQKALDNTKKIRVGSGGVMLPNHSPYIVAENYGTLETLYPNRVDLGLGRAPGTDLKTALSIRRNNSGREFLFEDEVKEIISYFEGTNNVHAYPAEGLNVPIYLLGSSTKSAYLAAKLGLPYSFASHFAPSQLEEAVKLYRNNFKASRYLSKPYVIIGVNVIMAENNNEANRLATSQLKAFTNIVSGVSKGIEPPFENEEEVWEELQKVKSTPHFGPVKFQLESLINNEKQVVDSMFKAKLVGDVEKVVLDIKELKKKVDFDELMTISYIYDEKAHHKSIELLKLAVDIINEENFNANIG